MATEFHELSIAELSPLIAARTLSPVELVEAPIRRIEQHDAQTRHAPRARQRLRISAFPARRFPGGERP